MPTPRNTQTNSDNSFLKTMGIAPCKKGFRHTVKSTNKPQSAKPKPILQRHLETFKELGEKRIEILKWETKLGDLLIRDLINGATVEPGNLQPKLLTVQQGHRRITTLVVR